MKIAILVTLTFLISLQLQARKPAVEDFVGVEPETYQATPKGTEVLFNFENQLKQQSNNQSKLSELTMHSNWFGVFALAAFIGLPFMMWYFISRSVKNENHVPAWKQSNDESENVAHLDQYREDNSDHDDHKKAS